MTSPLRPRVGFVWLAVICGALVGATRADAQLLRQPPAELTPLVASDGVQPGAELRVAIRVRLAEGLHVNSNKPRDPSLIPIVLTVDAPPGFRVEELVFPQPTDLEQEGADEPLAVFEREFAIGVRLTVAGDIPPGEVVVPARLRYQACDEKVCYIPATVTSGWTVRILRAGDTATALHADVFAGIPFGTGDAPPAPEAAAASPAAPVVPTGDRAALLDQFALLGSTGGYLGRDSFLTFIGNAESGVQERGLEGRGVLAIVLIVLLGGLALNLTPCVLPMIPINLAVIGAGVQAGSRRRGFLLGSAYGAAMAVVYGVLGLIVILTAGTFGTINASPWFNVTIAAVFIVLALAMFDVITIDFSRFSTRFNIGGSAGRGTFLVAFGMGAVAALLAGACVAPVVIQVVLFSSNLYAAGTTVALALPFLLGIGMAVPWPLAGAGISAIPKPGAWMVRVKQAFGVIVLGTAVYYGYLGYTLFADRWVDATEVAASVEEKLKAGWYASLDEGLAAAQREQKPVLVDLWATWCKNCLTMDKTTLADPAVSGALAGYVKIKFQAEDPDDAAVKEVMQRFGAIGLPTYVVLKPKT